MEGDMGGTLRLGSLAVALAVLTCILMASCESVHQGSGGSVVSKGTSELSLSADSYEIKGRVTGTVSIEIPDGMVFAGRHVLSEFDFTIFDAVIEQANLELARQGELLGADLLLFPTYSLERIDGHSLIVRGTAVAAVVKERPRSLGNS